MQLAPPRRTDGRSVDLHLLNDYTNSNVKEEASEYEANKKIKTVPVCAACQGGGQDNPKGWVFWKYRIWQLFNSQVIPRITNSRTKSVCARNWFNEEGLTQPCTTHR